MGLGIKVEVIHKETIQPSSPTPHHLKNTNLSVFDQFLPDIYVPILLFYPNNNCEEVNNLVAERSKLLKTSLSETLTHFYPFAGKFQYNDSICCNDHGAAFLETQVNCPISKILGKPDFVMLKQLLPADTESRQEGASYLVQVQANFFGCGGMAIGVCISHKVSDASTISKFISSWAAISFGSNGTTPLVLPAEFGVASSLFPPLDFLNTPQPPMEYDKENLITRRFVFDASKIAALKSKVATATVPNPTRVEVVSALIWKCAFEASRSNLGSVRPSEWFQFVNMRKILVQPSAENVAGNALALVSAKTHGSKVDGDVQSLVAKLRKCFKEFKVKYANDVSGEDVCEFFKDYWKLTDQDDVDTYTCSSWCRFPFYAVNFGWGRPSWVSQSMEYRNLIVLMDTRDGDGIEACLTLDEEEMAIFEVDKELLEYAALNPTLV
ncbi:unnamed protein product [Prunus armeniaca]